MSCEIYRLQKKKKGLEHETFKEKELHIHRFYCFFQKNKIKNNGHACCFNVVFNIKKKLKYTLKSL